jgi:hypothetical protein
MGPVDAPQDPAVATTASPAGCVRLFEEMSAEMGLKHVEELRLRKVLQAEAQNSTPQAMVTFVAVPDTKSSKKRAAAGFADLEEELMRVCKAMKTGGAAKAPAGLRPCPALMAATAA